MPTPGLIEATKTWATIGILSFGGPAAQIALMHKTLVDDNQWLTEKDFLHALSFCMLLPGPEAMQLATYAGWRLHGTLGGLIAGLLFIVPGALVVLGLAALYALFGDVSLVSALFFGIKAAVIVIVIEALIKVAKRALTHPLQWVLALFAFISLFYLAVPYPLVVLTAAAVGFAFHKQLVPNPTTLSTSSVSKQASLKTQDATKKRELTEAHATSETAKLTTWQATLRTVVIWLLIWWLPIGGLLAWGQHQLLVEIGTFFSTLAVVTFGGAYAVLAYLAQDAVTQYGWLSAVQMMDGLALAETTPGPLILVTEFVGFMAGFQQAGLAYGVAAAFVTLWVTFVPCFLWIFAGAPYIDWLSDQPRLKAALTAITAAVVGVILNLSLWFATNVVFGTVLRYENGPIQTWMPEWQSVQPITLALIAVCAVMTFAFKWPLLRVLVIAAALGYVLYPA